MTYDIVGQLGLNISFSPEYEPRGLDPYGLYMVTREVLTSDYIYGSDHINAIVTWVDPFFPATEIVIDAPNVSLSFVPTAATPTWSLSDFSVITEYQSSTGGTNNIQRDERIFVTIDLVAPKGTTEVLQLCASVSQNPEHFATTLNGTGTWTLSSGPGCSWLYEAQDFEQTLDGGNVTLVLIITVQNSAPIGAVYSFDFSFSYQFFSQSSAQISLGSGFSYTVVQPSVGFQLTCSTPQLIAPTDDFSYTFTLSKQSGWVLDVVVIGYGSSFFLASSNPCPGKGGFDDCDWDSSTKVLTLGEGSVRYSESPISGTPTFKTDEHAIIGQTVGFSSAVLNYCTKGRGCGLATITIPSPCKFTFIGDVSLSGVTITNTDLLGSAGTSELLPGETVTWQITIAVPPGTISGDSIITASFTDSSHFSVDCSSLTYTPRQSQNSSTGCTESNSTFTVVISDWVNTVSGTDTITISGVVPGDAQIGQNLVLNVDLSSDIGSDSSSHSALIIDAVLEPEASTLVSTAAAGEVIYWSFCFIVKDGADLSDIVYDLSFNTSFAFPANPAGVTSTPSGVVTYDNYTIIVDLVELNKAQTWCVEFTTQADATACLGSTFSTTPKILYRTSDHPTEYLEHELVLYNVSVMVEGEFIVSEVIVDSDVSSTVGTDLTIGESANFSFTVDLPQGTIQDFKVTATFAAAADVFTLLSALVTDYGGMLSLADDATLDNHTQTITGNEVVFEFGSLLGPANSAVRYIEFQLSGVVEANAAQGNLPLDIKHEYTSCLPDSSVLSGTDTTDLTIVAPTIDVLVTSSFADDVEGGDEVTYTVEIEFAADTSSAYSCNVELCVDLQPLPLFLLTDTVSSDMPLNSNVSNADSFCFSLDVFVQSDGPWTVTFNAVVTESAVVGQTLTVEADLTYYPNCATSVTVPAIVKNGNVDNTIAGITVLNLQHNGVRYCPENGVDKVNVGEFINTETSFVLPKATTQAVVVCLVFTPHTSYNIFNSSFTYGSLQIASLPDYSEVLSDGGCWNFGDIVAPVDASVAERTITFSLLSHFIGDVPNGDTITQLVYGNITRDSTVEQKTQQLDYTIVRPDLDIQIVSTPTDSIFAETPVVYDITVAFLGNSTSQCAFDVHIEMPYSDMTITDRSLSPAAIVDVTDSSKVDLLLSKQTSTISVQFTMNVDPTAVLESTLHAEPTVAWESSSEAFSNSYVDSDAVDLTVDGEPTFDFNVTESDTSILAALVDNVAIGEYIDMEFCADFPEGTIPNVTIAGSFDEGLTIQSVSHAGTGLGASLLPSLSPASVTTPSGTFVFCGSSDPETYSANEFCLHFGDIENQDSGVLTDNILCVLVQVLVDRDTPISNNDVLDYQTSLSWADHSDFITLPSSLTVQEPSVTITADVNSVTDDDAGKKYRFDVTIDFDESRETVAFDGVVRLLLDRNYFEVDPEYINITDAPLEAQPYQVVGDATNEYLRFVFDTITQDDEFSFIVTLASTVVLGEDIDGIHIDLVYFSAPNDTNVAREYTSVAPNMTIFTTIHPTIAQTYSIAPGFLTPGDTGFTTDVMVATADTVTVEITATFAEGTSNLVSITSSSGTTYGARVATYSIAYGPQINIPVAPVVVQDNYTISFTWQSVVNEWNNQPLPPDTINITIEYIVEEILSHGENIDITVDLDYEHASDITDTDIQLVWVEKLPITTIVGVPLDSVRNPAFFSPFEGYQAGVCLFFTLSFVDNSYTAQDLAITVTWNSDLGAAVNLSTEVGTIIGTAIPHGIRIDVPLLPVFTEFESDFTLCLAETTVFNTLYDLNVDWDFTITQLSDKRVPNPPLQDVDINRGEQLYNFTTIDAMREAIDMSFSTSLPETTDPSVNIGEVVTSISISRLNYGTALDLNVSCNTNNGLSFATAVVNFEDKVSSTEYADGAAIVPVDLMDNYLIFQFGVVTCDPQLGLGILFDEDAEFSLTITALVEDFALNVTAGDSLVTDCVLTYDGLTNFPASDFSVVVEEPELSIEWALSPDNGDSGDIVTFCVNVSHTAASTSQSGYELVFTHQDLASHHLETYANSFAQTTSHSPVPVVAGDGDSYTISFGDPMLDSEVLSFCIDLRLLDTLEAGVDVPGILATLDYTSAPNGDARVYPQLTTNELTFHPITPFDISRQHVSTGLTESDNRTVTIGELITTKVELLLTEGTITGLRLDCYSDVGLSLHSGSIFFPERITGPLNNDDTPSFNASLAPSIYHWWYDMGTVVNQWALNQSEPDIITFTFNTFVEDLPTTFKDDQFSFYCEFYSDTVTVPFQTTPITYQVLEPELAIDKAFSPPEGDAGDVFLFEFTISHTTDSQVDAFDFILTTDLGSNDLRLVNGSWIFNDTCSITDGFGPDDTIVVFFCPQIAMDEVFKISFEAYVLNSAITTHVLKGDSLLQYFSTKEMSINGGTFNEPREYQITTTETSITMNGVPTILKELDSTSISSPDMIYEDELEVHEVATYKITITLPEGTTNELFLEDQLPEGLLPINTWIDYTPTTTVENYASGDPGTIVDHTVSYDFGSIVNEFDQNVGTIDDMIIVYIEGIVEDIESVVRGVELTNNVVLSHDDNLELGPLAPVGDSVTISVIEPDLVINKTCSLPWDAKIDAGDTANFTITVEHTSLSNGTAWDLVIHDLGNIDLRVIEELTWCTHSCTIEINGKRDVQVSAPSLPLGEVFTLFYGIVVKLSAEQGESLFTLNEVFYDSSPNDVDGWDGRDYYNSIITPNFEIKPLNFSVTLSGTSISQTVDPEVTIGEVITIDVLLPLPEATIKYLLVEFGFPGHIDNPYPGRMRIIDARMTALGTNLVNITGPMANYSENEQLPVDDYYAVFDFGTLVNLDDNRFFIETDAIQLQVKAVVEDDPDHNFDGVPLGVNVTITSQPSGQPITIQENDNITFVIIEPDLTMRIESSVDTRDRFENVTFTIYITHTNASTSDAFDLQVIDRIGFGYEFDPGSLSVFVVPAVAVPDNRPITPYSEEECGVIPYRICNEGSFINLFIPEFTNPINYGAQNILIIQWTLLVSREALTGGTIPGDAIMNYTSAPIDTVPGDSDERFYYETAQNEQFNTSFPVFIPCEYYDLQTDRFCNCSFPGCTQGTRTESDCVCNCETRDGICGTELGGFANVYRDCVCDCSLLRCNNDAGGVPFWQSEGGGEGCSCLCDAVNCNTGSRDPTNCECNCDEAYCLNGGERIDGDESCGCDCAVPIANDTCKRGFVNAKDCSCNCTRIDCGDGGYNDDCTCNCGPDPGCANGAPFSSENCACNCSGISYDSSRQTLTNNCEIIPFVCEAPALVSASFDSPQAESISIVFDRDTNRAGMGPFSSCRELFSDASMPYLYGPYEDITREFNSSNWFEAVALCRWKSDSVLEIRYSEKSTIEPGVVLILRRNVLRAYDAPSLDCPATFGIIEVQPPITSTPPVAVIAELGLWSKCTDLLLDGSQSETTTGKRLSYDWKLLSPDPDTTNITIEFLGVLESTPHHEVFIVDYYLLYDLEYIVQLTVTDFLGVSDSVTESFTRTRIPRPTITFAKRNVVFNEKIIFRLEAEAELPVCILNYDEEELLYHWDIVAVEPAENVPNNHGLGDDVFSSPVFIVPRVNYFTRDTIYHATLTVQIASNPEYEKSATQVITIIAQNLVATIADYAAEATVSNFRDITLSAIIEGGHPDSEYPKNYSWSCSYDTEIPTEFTNQTFRGSRGEEDCALFSDGETLTIPNGTFADNQTVRFFLYVSYTGGIIDTFFEARDTVLLTFVDASPPTLIIEQKPSGVQSTTEQINMRAQLYSASGEAITNAEYLWTSEDIELDPSILLVDSNALRSLIIAPNVLSGGYDYRISVVGTDPSTGLSAFGVVSFTTAWHPFGGSFTVDRTVGIGFETVFTMCFKHWGDGEDNEKLRYGFGYTTADSVIWMKVDTLPPCYHAILPPQAIGLVGSIKTQLDYSTIVDIPNIRVLPSNLTGASLVEVFFAVIEDEFAAGFFDNADLLLGAIGSEVAANAENNEFIFQTSEVIQRLVFILSFLQRFRSNGDASVDQASGLVSQFVACGASSLSLSEIYALAKDISEDFVTTNNPTSSGAPDLILRIVNGLINCAYNTNSSVTSGTCDEFSDECLSSELVPIDSEDPTTLPDATDPIVLNLLIPLARTQQQYQQKISLITEVLWYEIHSGLAEGGTAVTPAFDGELSAEFLSTSLSPLVQHILGIIKTSHLIPEPSQNGTLLSNLYRLMLALSSANPKGGAAPYLDLIGYDFLSDAYSGEEIYYVIPVRNHVTEQLMDFGIDITNLVCSYVDPVTSLLKSDGCELLNTFLSNNTLYANCCCNHLTDFGLTMGSSADNPSSPSDFNYLTIIYIVATVGSGLIVLSIMAVGAVYGYWTRQQTVNRINSRMGSRLSSLDATRKDQVEEGEILDLDVGEEDLDL
eukprot:CAMPEP_0174249714 /NCGR_PEP_ID=MMETSP0439-20130205/45_1 /TAXON_ID=0 /ORGANISM="Stereomyxa ramosa, Strain Chinc5" /LENGTH=4418 /DNA_ID=CAMNT_0015329607 /DNA_START=406 /DNA_END=13662 /DNA_ORIENTATION=+